MTGGAPAGPPPATARWLALSDLPPPAARDRPTGALARGMLVVELAQPLTAAAILLDLRGGEGALSLIHDPGLGLAVLHRGGGRLVRHLLPGAPLDGIGPARLVLDWDAGQDRWHMALGRPGRTAPVEARGTGALPLALAHLQALAGVAPPPPRHPVVLWWGVTAGQTPQPLPRLGPRTPVDVPGGLTSAAALRPGDLVLTDRGPRRLRRVLREMLPGRGSLAPVRLRAPYFRRGGDAVVSPEQPVRLTGTDVEYLFGQETVLARAADLIDGRRALHDERSGPVAWIGLELETPAILECSGLGLGLGAAARVLTGWEAQALTAHRRRGNSRNVA